MGEEEGMMGIDGEGGGDDRNGWRGGEDEGDGWKGRRDGWKGRRDGWRWMGEEEGMVKMDEKEERMVEMDGGGNDGDEWKRRRG